MTLVTENQMRLKHILFISVHKCNGMNDTLFLSIKCNFFYTQSFTYTTDNSSWN